jgi:DNA ligase-1
MSEKFDGVRAYWDGRALRTRSWRAIEAPAWWLAALPTGVALDGELWGGRGTFQTASELSRFSRASDPAWSEMRFMIFDWPTTEALGFEARAARLADYERGPIEAVGAVRCTGAAHAVARLAEVTAGGGEGLMLKKPGHCYFFGRSAAWLKVKPAGVE